mmetsp:Transcript_35971/g.113038  ORF Transcript_35971/g.113038 Transcript_35971/m.113038 type:complete len:515 (-) Transcript_35971:102-1646(-)|eukprot:CAMPEP_0118867192 /NCGR_PEP_ID=MMETSP1163-20130328/10869_1 /TAXON_ID=124430 /ORGANISM="Phaeomonas parva, Strain CCMP2877" /LENGTH=514 /DNA_ID=CAMNT_0006801579 /DNA_START=142 /DNA_END=1686 /DNA_ORIENTATION=-
MSSSLKTSSVEDQPVHRVRRHRALMEKMRGDNEVLKQDLARESREAIMTGNMTGSADIIRLQDEADRYASKIEAERKKIAELDSHIDKVQAKILEQRRKIGGVNAAKENNERIEKEIRKLENRLDKALVKFNESLARNKQLRQKIDDMRRERVVFDGIYEKLERELHEKKKEMQAIIEASNHAYDARSRAFQEMAALKSQADGDRQEFQREWAELGRLIEQDRKIRENMRAQNAEAKEEAKDEALLTMHQEEEMINTTDGSESFIKDTRAPHLQLTETTVASYEEAFKKIAKAVGSTDVEEVVQKFLDAEEKNFSLFNFVNEQNSEIERLELMISETKAEIERFKGQGMSSDRERKKNLRSLEERLKKTEEKANEHEETYQAAMKTINQLKQGIHSIFSRIGCASTSVEEMLGNQGVTESNMMQYLGIIEQRTNEILQMYAASQAANDPGLLVQNSVESVAPMKLSIAPPGLNDYDSDDDSEQDNDERPLTREELTRKTLRGINRRERTSKARR